VATRRERDAADQPADLDETKVRATALLDRIGDECPGKARLGPRAASVRFVALILGLSLVALALHFASLAINVTGSMPVGIYHIERSNRTAAKGDIVQLCADPAVAAVARRLDYLPHGSCPSDTAPMLKIVAAVAGDAVEVRDDAVIVGEHRLRGSATQARDSQGRSLQHFPRGLYRMRSGEIWLWTPNPLSWDSRYYGPQPAAGVSGFATLVMAFWDWPYAHAR
jgi:conjugative transfer signal peptidase TraF